MLLRIKFFLSFWEELVAELFFLGGFGGGVLSFSEWSIVGFLFLLEDFGLGEGGGIIIWDWEKDEERGSIEFGWFGRRGDERKELELLIWSTPWEENCLFSEESIPLIVGIESRGVCESLDGGFHLGRSISNFWGKVWG